MFNRNSIYQQDFIFSIVGGRKTGVQRMFLTFRRQARLCLEWQ